MGELEDLKKQLQKLKQDKELVDVKKQIKELGGSKAKAKVKKKIKAQKKVGTVRKFFQRKGDEEKNLAFLMKM